MRAASMVALVMALIALALGPLPAIARHTPRTKQSLVDEYVLPAYHNVPYLQPNQPCPCKNQSLCAPLTVGDRQEVFGFTVSNDWWPLYDWSLATTVAIGGIELEAAMLCVAHAHNTRIVVMADYPLDQLANYTHQREWVAGLVTTVQSLAMDGVNVDFEDPIAKGSGGVKDLNRLISMLTDAMHTAVPDSQVSVDLAWSPSGIDGRWYDAKTLSEVSDLLYIMSYDLRSQIYDLDDCVASANSPIERVRAGIANYTDIDNIPAHKMVLGVPWYSYDYACLNGTGPTDSRCPVKHVPYMGAPCSDAAGSEIDFQLAQSLLAQSTTGLQWNDQYKTPWFNYIDSNGLVHQVWMDNEDSLVYKYLFVREAGLRGTGPWTFDFLNYSRPAINPSTPAMWELMKIVLDSGAVDRGSGSGSGNSSGGVVSSAGGSARAATVSATLARD